MTERLVLVMNPNLFPLPTQPEACALLVAPPLNFSSFKQDAEMSAPDIPAQNARGDYAFRIVNAMNDKDVEKAWAKNGKSVAGLCSRLIRDAKSVGARVYSDATRERLVWLTGEGNVSTVVIVAHWRSSRVAASDLRLSYLQSTINALRTSTDPFELNLFYRLDSVVSDCTSLPRAPEIANAISAEVCAEAGHKNESPDDVFMSAPERAIDIGLVRDKIDKRFPDFLVPGHCLELRDGYHKAAEIANMFDDNWGGVVELAVCHSMYLAQCIKSGRDDRRVITNEYAKHPDLCIPELQETFLRLSSGYQNYIELRVEVHRSYSGILNSGS